MSSFYLSDTLSECQTVWIKIGTVVVPVLVWVQTFFKTKIAASNLRNELKMGETGKKGGSVEYTSNMNG